MAPIVIAAIAVAGAAVSAVGAIKQGQAAEAAANYNAAVAENNGKMAIDQASLQEDQQRRQSRAQLGQMRAQYAASGIQLEGTPMDVLEMSARDAELDALTIRYGGQMRALGYKNDAALSRFEGSTAASNANWKAGGTMLQGIASAAGSMSGGGGGKGMKGDYAGVDKSQLRYSNYA